MNGRLEGKTAIVTGGGGGIGRATAIKMAQEGARVMVADILADGAASVVEEIRAAGGEGLEYQLDLGVPDEIKAMVATAVGHFGRLDILHNNAAATDLVEQDHDVATIDLELWERMLQVNLRGTMLASQEAIPHMIQAGTGAIINTTSISAVAGDLGYSAYGASKGGVNSLTLYIATQYGKAGLRCNAVAPGVVLSQNSLDKIPAEPLREYERQHLTPRLGKPTDVANVVAFLASDEAAFVTGQIINVDGGLFSHNPTVGAFRASQL